MTPRQTHFQSDNDSLQADVMRFMAIIAFCLIAILALVRHAEPPPGTAGQTAENALPDTPVAPVAMVASKTVRPTPIKVEPASAWREPLIRPEPAANIEPDPPAPTARPALERQPLALEKLTPPQPSAVVTAADSAPKGPAEEEGLSLRFASDGDFLRLIAKADISVYAYRDGEVLTLTSSYAFLPSAAPGQVYELLPSTIPTLIVDALKRARREHKDADTFTWAIALPGNIRTQLEGHLAAVRSGQLVIDRYGEVHHVAGD